MKFIVTEVSSGREQSVTRECVDRIKGKYEIDRYIKRVQETGKPMEMFFESNHFGTFDLKIVNE